MKRSRICVLIFLMLMVLACQPVLFEPEPKNTPEVNFESLWQDFHEIYPAFERRKVNWDSVYQVYRPQVTSQSSSMILFTTVSNMLATLKDAHVSIHSSIFGEARYKIVNDGYPKNFLGIDYVKTHIIPGYKSSQYRNVIYKLLPQNIGYVYIASFGGNSNRGEYTIIDQIIQEFRDTKGIIIDVRDNGGGSNFNGETIANRFADQKRIGNYLKWKKSSAPNDLTDFDPSYVKPDGPLQFIKQVMVLTNRDCFSATEDFIGLMKSLPHVKQVGGASGGGSGIAYTRDLPNGWTFTVPRTLGYSHEKVPVEKSGYLPDYPATISQQDIDNGFDRIFQEAIDRIL